jgi:hypothetical protein
MCIVPTDLLCDETADFVMDEETDICVNPTTGDTSPPYQHCPKGTEPVNEDSDLFQTGSGCGGTSNRNIPTTECNHSI